MHIVSGFFVCEIAGETIAIPSGQAAHRISGLVAFNDTGKFLFELLQTEQTEESLVSALMDTYDVDFTTAQADVSEFLTLLQEHHLLADD